MLIVGSEAFSKINPTRKPNDLDIIIPYNRLDKTLSRILFKKTDYHITINDDYVVIEKKYIRKIELLLAKPGNAWWMYLEKYNAFSTSEIKTIDAHGLYSLKKSHIHIPLKFNKHIYDYCVLHKIVGGKDIMPEITKKNTEDIKHRLDKDFNSPSLNKTVKEFFAQSEGKVKSWFVHDHIHEVMAHYDRPLYENMQKDLTMARCEKDMWEDFTYEDKIKCVLEEAYVIALERKIIPVLFGGEAPYVSPSEALRWAMMRICTTLTGGWFREFATNNYFDILNWSDSEYVNKFLNCVQNKQINLIKE